MKYFMSILVLVMVSYSTPVFGQPTLTVRGGMNLTTFGGSVMMPNSARASIRMGIAVVIPVWHRLSLQFGGDYVPKGVRDINREFKLNIDYIEFSGLAIITLISPRRAPSLSILIGPTLAFKVKTKNEGSVAESYWYWGDPLEYSAWDYGIAGGIGTQMAISEAMTVKAELLYTRNSRSINKTTSFNPANVTNRAISFTIGLGFPFSARLSRN